MGKKKMISALLTAALAVPMATNALALSYTVDGVDSYNFHGSTNYEDVYGSEYNYGGKNPTDFYDLSKLPGVGANDPVYETPDYDYGDYDMAQDLSPNFNYADDWDGITSGGIAAHTDVNTLVRGDGSVGSLSIPSLGICMNAYRGATNESMRKGLGHFDDMSGWDGNIGLVGVRPDRTLLNVV